MAELGKITPQEAAEAKAKKLGFKDTSSPRRLRRERRTRTSASTCRTRSSTTRTSARPPKDAQRLLQRGGLTIKTTLDPKMQKAAEKAIKQYVTPATSRSPPQAMVVPGTGAIKAMAASRKFGGSKQEEERDQLQPGRRRRARRRQRLPGGLDVQGLHAASPR